MHPNSSFPNRLFYKSFWSWILVSPKPGRHLGHLWNQNDVTFWIEGVVDLIWFPPAYLWLERAMPTQNGDDPVQPNLKTHFSTKYGKRFARMSWSTCFVDHTLRWNMLIATALPSARREIIIHLREFACTSAAGVTQWRAHCYGVIKKLSP